MEFKDIVSVAPSLGGAILLAWAYWTFKKVDREARKEIKEYSVEAVQSATEELSLKIKDLESKIIANEVRIDVLEKNIEKDLEHIKETYNNAVQNLATKIDDLRDDVKQQHTQLIQILTKLIDSEKD